MVEQLKKASSSELKKIFDPSLERYWYEIFGIINAHGPKNQPPSSPPTLYFKKMQFLGVFRPFLQRSLPNSTGAGKSSPNVERPSPICPIPLAKVLATGNKRSVTFLPKIFFPRTYNASSTVKGDSSPCLFNAGCCRRMLWNIFHILFVTSKKRNHKFSNSSIHELGLKKCFLK